MDTIAIIGGGAAGLMAAVQAARAFSKAGESASVVVYEADDERVGRSILATGNGRCNISNAHIQASAYHNGEFVSRALMMFQNEFFQERGKRTVFLSGCDPVLERFEDMGLWVREEAEGRLYPLANKATSVLDALRATAAALGVRIEVGKRAVRIDAPGGAGSAGACFNIRFADKTIAHARQVIVAVGGRAADRIELPGPLACSKMRPVLGPLRVAQADTRVTRQLNNVRLRCGVHLQRGGKALATEKGEVLFRDYGLSGVAIFNLSRDARAGDALVIDVFPDCSEGAVKEFLFARRKRMTSLAGQITRQRFCEGILLPSVAQAFLKRTGIKPDAAVSKDDMPALAHMLKATEFTVEGIGDEKQCQVRRGGFPVEKFRAQTCESIDIAGLFVTGEALDVDGPCGGYNLHWAWTSGMLAGLAAAENVME